MPAIKQIQMAVCDAFNVSLDQMLSNKRAYKYAHPRIIAMALSREFTTASYPTIARHFNRTDHTTVTHAVKRSEELQVLYPDFAQKRNAAVSVLFPT